jgi:type IV pilus assembly protein PilM
MASNTGSVWAVDIGNNSLKAMRLTDVNGVVEVTGFDNIQHGKILTGIGVKPEEREELIAISLRQFVQQNDISADDIAISVPSQNSFARFVNLPPVEAKRIPEIVKFEAAQQIPFDISEVQWDWQLMNGGHSAETETRVGIFAIKNDVISSSLEYFSRENINVNFVQMAPMALYNYIVFDRPELVKSDSRAIVILNIGAECTDLVVCSRSSVWQRCIPMGGNSFTRAIAETFKLTFEKSEKLKRTAPMSKYARQILQAMKPVFTDLASEIQRSLGFYTSGNPDVKLSKMVAFGGGTKMQGLLKYLQQTLQIPIERPDTFKRLALSPDLSTAKFHESICDFGIVYGLGLQGLGLGKIESNLLPTSVARSMAWAAKAKHFTIAAVLLLAVAILGVVRGYVDSVNYDKQERTRLQTRSITSKVDEAVSKLQDIETQAPALKAAIDKEFEIFEYRDVVPSLYTTIISALPNADNTADPRQKQVYEAFAAGDIDRLKKVPRNERKQLFVTSLSIKYAPSVKHASFEQTGMQSRSMGAITMPSAPSMGSGMPQQMFQNQAENDYQSDDGLPTQRPGQAAADADDGPGFVVSIAGYSPYAQISELLDPTGVADDPDKWGFVTRLMHTGDANPNAPFVLYNKTDPDHFRPPKTGEVDIGSAMPIGIGILADAAEYTSSGGGRITDAQVLIDPMTKEVISKPYSGTPPAPGRTYRTPVPRATASTGQARDHWFSLDMKFLWNDAPKGEQPVGDMNTY